VHDLREAVQAIVSCVTPAVVLPSGFRGAGPHVLAFAARDDPAPLRSDHHPRLALSVSHWYHVVQEEASGHWVTAVVGYEYRLLSGARELLAYHWHPFGRSPVTWPHLHVNASVESINLDSVHLPTGLVALAAVIRCAITDLGVAPLRPDWRAILDRERA